MCRVLNLVRQQYEIHTELRVAVDALVDEYNHDARTQSTHFSVASLQSAVGGRGLGSTDLEEQCTQRTSFVATCYTSAHSSSSRSSCRAWMLGCK